MANEEHLAILKKGVDAWNEWRTRNQTIKPDLSDADLRGSALGKAYLSAVNLRGADLRVADLRVANLRRANLRVANLGYARLNEADFREAYLREADFSGAILSRANLSKQDLSNTNLSYARLSEADLRETYLKEAILEGAIFNGAKLTAADLRGAILRGVKLRGAVFGKTDLTEADLTEADLSYADLRGAILRGAKLRGAIFNGAKLSKQDLSNADLIGAGFQEASLQAARLFDAKLDMANLTGACLWETQRAGWSIKGVICESVYWDEEAKEKTLYAPGEFERLFADKMRIKLFYKGGISTLEIVTLPSLIQHLADSHPGSKLRLESIKNDAGGAVIELSIEGADDYSPEQVKQLQAALQKEAQEKAEVIHLALTHKEAIHRLEGKLEMANSFVKELINRPTYLITGDIMADNKAGDTYNISGQAGAVGPNAHAHDMTFNQLVQNVEQSIDLAALATQLSELRQAMAVKQDASPQAAISIGKVAEAEIAATEKNTPKVVEHLKSAGQWTLDFAKSIGKDVVAAAIKKSMGVD